MEKYMNIFVGCALTAYGLWIHNPDLPEHNCHWGIHPGIIHVIYLKPMHVVFYCEFADYLSVRRSTTTTNDICASIFSVYRKWTKSMLLFRRILIKDCGKSLNFYGSSNIGSECTRRRHRYRVKKCQSITHLRRGKDKHRDRTSCPRKSYWRKSIHRTDVKIEIPSYTKPTHFSRAMKDWQHWKCDSTK